jgi:hypothetical protein
VALRCARCVSCRHGNTKSGFRLRPPWPTTDCTPFRESLAHFIKGLPQNRGNLLGAGFLATWCAAAGSKSTGDMGRLQYSTTYLGQVLSADVPCLPWTAPMPSVATIAVLRVHEMQRYIHTAEKSIPGVGSHKRRRTLSKSTPPSHGPSRFLWRQGRCTLPEPRSHRLASQPLQEKHTISLIGPSAHRQGRALTAVLTALANQHIRAAVTLTLVNFVLGPAGRTVCLVLAAAVETFPVRFEPYREYE